MTLHVNVTLTLIEDLLVGLVDGEVMHRIAFDESFLAVRLDHVVVVGAIASSVRAPFTAWPTTAE